MTRIFELKDTMIYTFFLAFGSNLTMLHLYAFFFGIMCIIGLNECDFDALLFCFMPPTIFVL